MPMGVAMVAVIEVTWLLHSNALYSVLLGHMHALCNMIEPRSMDKQMKNQLRGAQNVHFDHQKEVFCNQ